MFVINVLLQVQQSEDVAEVRENLREAGRLSRLEPGCLQFTVCQDQGEERNFVLFERWESQHAWEIHKQAMAFLTIYQPLVLPKVTRTPYFCQVIE